MQTSLIKAGKNLAANVVQLRADSQLTLAQLAAATGVSARTLKRLEVARQERRTYNPAFKTVARLAAAAQITVDEFVSARINVFQ